MTHSYGRNRKTRHTYARKFRKHGIATAHSYNQVYRLGQYVDIKANGSVHKGMPHRLYVGKTGRVWNITPRAIGVEVNKTVGCRVIRKRLHIRVEHIALSKCRDAHVARVAANEAARANAKKLIAEAKKAGKKISVVLNLKRTPELPKPQRTIRASKSMIIDVSPLRYAAMY